MESTTGQIGHLVQATKYEERWTRGARIGGGGQGKTFRAVRKSDGVEACLKLLKDNGNKKRRRRFIEEANALALIEHLRVPRLIETNATRERAQGGKGAAQLYIVTEYVPGTTLEKYVEANGTMAPRDAVVMALEILAVLAALHPSRVHRDLKPANVILRNGDVRDPVLIDFGISASSDPEVLGNTTTGEELGPRFLRLPELAPESDDKRQPATDLTHAAALLLFAMTGHEPNTLEDTRGRRPHQAVRDQILNAPGVDGTRLMEIFDRAFRPIIAQRYGSAEDLSEELRDSIGEKDKGTKASEILRGLWARYGEVTPEQAQQYFQRNQRMLLWARDALDRLRPLPSHVTVTEMDSYCPEHRNDRVLCKQLGFAIHEPGDWGQHVLPHLTSEVIGDEVVLAFKHRERTGTLARCPIASDVPSATEASAVEDFFARCLGEALA